MGRVFWGVIALGVVLTTSSFSKSDVRIYNNDIDHRVVPPDRYLQILHVNDLHSYWDGERIDSRGGYAKIKTLLDSLEADGTSKGWTTVRLDAGDFSDGNINFLSDKGVTSYKFERALKFDAVALGNHDYLTGLNDLKARFADPDQRVPFIAANFSELHSTGVESGKIIYRDGLKIAVVGATIQSKLYNWAAWPATFSNPQPATDLWLALHPADVRIALTHIGDDEDRLLAGTSSKIDVIIGGHSHIVINKPWQVPNSLHRLIPIAQAGSHGEYVGQMLLKISSQGPPQLVDYNMIPVTQDIPDDENIAQLIKTGQSVEDQRFKQTLTEVVATSNKNYFTHKERAPLIGNFLADSMREATGSEVALDSGYLYGDNLPSGPVTIETIFSLAPHTYKWSTDGWHIYTCNAYAATLEIALAWVSSTSHGTVAVSGIDLALNRFHVPRHVYVDGKPIDIFRTYKTAFSEGFMAALAGRPHLASLLCSDVTDTGILVRDALLAKSRSLKYFSDETLGPARVHFW
jgi:5'-nucleotidase/UDP-sugar diphosphatase